LSVPSEKMTEAILTAWDEVEGVAPPEDSSEETEPVVITDAGEEAQDEVSPDEEAEETEDEEVVSVEPGEEVSDEEPSEEEEPEEEPTGDEEEPSTASFSSDDPDVQTFLARHGDVESALKAAARFETVLGRQGRELGQLRERARQLEEQLEQTRLFGQDGGYLSAEERTWVEEAVSSENPLAYIQSAVREGEFDLARAVLDGSELPTGQVIRLAQAIDRAEGQHAPAEQAAPLDKTELLDIVQQYFPDMPKFEAEMVSTLQGLDSDHPLYALAHSDDPMEATNGIIALYEIARAKTATVSSTREEVKKRTRDAAAAVREKAVVSSGQATPSKAQAARQSRVMPGLTLEALDAEFDRQSQ
jgi:hypothetical protein